MKQNFKIASWLGTGVLAGALIATQITAAASGPVGDIPVEELRQLAAVFGAIKTDYVEKVDEKKLITDAINGMVSGLDPHSQYFGEKDFKSFQEGTSGRFVGVGIEISQEDGYVKVVTPIEGSPAFRAGIKANDLITRVDDWNTRGEPLNDAVKRMRGEPNTRVVLTLLRRDENNRTFTVTLNREEIKVASVKSKLIEPGYGWIRILQFQQHTLGDFVKQANDLARQDPHLKGLVLDLRNDPGGLMDAAIGISAAFLPKGLDVVSTRGQLKESRFTYKASPEFYRGSEGGDPLQTLNPVYKKIPLVVLVNEGSASASEIVSGALQDHQRAVVMGSQTFGKGSVQNFRALSEKTGMKITIAHYFTPSGKSIQSKGVVPDVWIDDIEGGSPFAVLRFREADYEKHLKNPQGEESDAARTERLKKLEAEKEEARKLMELEAKKPPEQRILPEFGSARDFQLRQALNRLQNKPVIASKIQSERKVAKKADD